MSGEKQVRSAEAGIEIKEETSAEGESAFCEMTLDSLLLMMTLSEDDFIINVSLSEEDSDGERR